MSDFVEYGFKFFLELHQMMIIDCFANIRSKHKCLQLKKIAKYKIESNELSYMLFVTPTFSDLTYTFKT